ncbi:MAG: hypothetical protein WBD01_07235, partial [Salaquimonas sp.]
MAKAAVKKTSASNAKQPPKVAKPASPDDLKRISGVGPKLEGVLNGLGIYRYAQIAKWTKPEVSWVDDHLKFSGRIDRDEWIKQCKAFAAESAKAAKAKAAPAKKAGPAKAKTAPVKKAPAKKAATKKPAVASSAKSVPTVTSKRVAKPAVKPAVKPAAKKVTKTATKTAAASKSSAKTSSKASPNPVAKKAAPKKARVA